MVRAILTNEQLGTILIEWEWEVLLLRKVIFLTFEYLLCLVGEFHERFLRVSPGP